MITSCITGKYTHNDNIRLLKKWTENRSIDQYILWSLLVNKNIMITSCVTGKYTHNDNILCY